MLQKTVYKSSTGELYTLATDIGYAHSGATWESLNGVDGDTLLVDEFFTPYRTDGMQPVASDTQVERFVGSDEDAE